MSNMTGKQKTVIGLAGVGAAGLLGYGIYYALTGQGIITQCEAQQQTIFNKWISTLSTYLQQDSANGTSLTQEQQDNLNTIMSALNAQQQSCIAAQKKLSQPIDTIIGDASAIISSAIAAAIIIYGLSKAYKVVKGKKPPSSGGGKTWPEAAAFITPILVQDLYDNGDITQDEAEAMSKVATGQYQTSLIDAVQTQVAFFVQQSLFTELEATAYITLATETITEDMEIVALVLV
jgi:hypothetical protein